MAKHGTAEVSMAKVEHATSQFESVGMGHVQTPGLDDSIHKFAQGAKSGAIAVDPDGGKQLMAFADAIEDWHTKHGVHLHSAATPPQLGASIAANVVSPFMGQVGTDEHGYLVQLEKLAQSMGEFKTAVVQAMQNYQQGEQASAAQFGKVGS